MSQWSAKDASFATNGTVQGEWQARGVTIDSRNIQGGELHVCIHGERVDGHAFALDALTRGASAVMVHHLPEGVPPEKVLQVDDTLQGLTRLGAAGRARFEGRVIGVTGSVGKTSTKDMLRLMLEAQGETFASHGNFNNHIGTPLNLANLPQAARFAVCEMGMSAAGEILSLTKLVRPHVAAITTVAPAHLEFFNSVEAIADAKAEIFQGLEPGGVAVLNADNPYFERLRGQVGNAQVLTFGEGKADCRVLRYTPKGAGCEVEIDACGERVTFAMQALGRQWAQLAALSLACAHALELDIRTSAEALRAFSETPGRGRLQSVAVKGGEAVLFDDSYNASPEAMRAAIAKLADARGKGRLLAALSDMRELGTTAPQLHAALAENLKAARVEQVFTAGPLMRHLHDALPAHQRGLHTEKAADLLPVLREALQPGDVLLLKGSHGTEMYKVAQALAMGNTA